MNSYDCLCPVSNLSSNILRIYIVGLRINISKYSVPPQYSTQFADAANVSGVVITSSPGPIPAAKQAAWRADVPFEMATAYFAPT